MTGARPSSSGEGMTRIRGAVDVEAACDTVIDDNRIAHVALAWRDNVAMRA